MERKSWLWRRKSAEKISEETESSGSASSGRFSDEQEASRASPNQGQSPEVSSSLAGSEVQATVKSLKEKLSAALSSMRSKDALVKQHAKVAEEAVSGWEKAENEVAALKQQLEFASQKNLALEDRVDHLNVALKECLRQLRQERDEQEQKIQEATTKAMQEWESAKFQLESRLTELETHLEMEKANAHSSSGHDIHSKLESAEKECSALKLELLARAEELEVMAIERELSTQAAETASKQQLESIKKVAKLEAECRRLRNVAQKSSFFAYNDQKHPSPSSFYSESLVDDCLDSREHPLSLDFNMHKKGNLESSECNLSSYNSWESTLISEHQVKNKKAFSRSLTSTSVDIDFMDDFLEMEKLVAMPGKRCSSCIGVVKDNDDGLESPLKAEVQAMIHRFAELEGKLEKAEDEKTGLEAALAESQNQLKQSQSRLMEVEEHLLELQRQLSSSNELKQAAEVEAQAASVKIKEAESLLECVNFEVHILQEKVASLEALIAEERATAVEIETKCQSLEDELARRKHESELWATSLNDRLKIKQEEGLAFAAGKLAECQKTIVSLGQQLQSLTSLEDFLANAGVAGPDQGLPAIRSVSALRPRSNSIPATKEVCPNSIAKVSPPSASSSPASRAAERSRNGAGKLFSRSNSSRSNRIER